jgi:16S rRNA processing protein RimM
LTELADFGELTGFASMEELVAVAKILKTRGLRGETVAELLTDFPERFENLEQVTGIAPTGGHLDLKIEKFWFQKGRVILKFAGYDTVEAAEALRNYEVCVPESEAVELDEGEFFDWELKDCRVETLQGVEIGAVREVMRTGGTEILVVQGADKEYLVPFSETICVRVDIEEKLIRIDPPEGLLEF